MLEPLTFFAKMKLMISLPEIDNDSHTAALEPTFALGWRFDYNGGLEAFTEPEPQTDILKFLRQFKRRILLVGDPEFRIECCPGHKPHVESGALKTRHQDYFRLDDIYQELFEKAREGARRLQKDMRYVERLNLPEIVISYFDQAWRDHLYLPNKSDMLLLPKSKELRNRPGRKLVKIKEQDQRVLLYLQPLREGNFCRTVNERLLMEARAIIEQRNLEVRLTMTGGLA